MVMTRLAGVLGILALLVLGSVLATPTAWATGGLVVFVIDQTAAPVPGATVTITGPATASGTAGASGAVQFSNVAEGTYTITATAPNLPDGTLANVFVNGEQGTAVTVSMGLNQLIAAQRNATQVTSGYPPLFAVIGAAPATLPNSVGQGITVTLHNSSGFAATNVALHIAPASGQVLATCYAGAPGQHPCVRAGNTAEWIVSDIPGGGSSGTYTIQTTGDPGPTTIWYSWSVNGVPGQYVVQLTAPVYRPPLGDQIGVGTYQ